ncbi:hypothetical protein DN752_10185 [Echinicola strongylocentroti]|uniref:LVIVD repeat-containing protein n=1 Tax=Echinicola strongylocentroti TaxID=1795355 RepID=A0A2Z4IR39_9BACT|nr:hypothetical protein [Echinicola strongylocentroti]AWW33128.1 hypothetical protein DN752_10185 [Echinicola strongylocentroti]
MRTRLLSMVLLTVVMFSSCDREDDVPGTGNDSILVSNDAESLSKRFSKDKTGVVGITSEAAVNARINAEEIPAGSLPLELIAKVEAPTYDGNILQATHVDIDGDYAYVTYNTKGAKYLGAIDIFDISDVHNPVIKSQAIFTDADLNAVDFVEGQLYIAAAVDVDADYGVDGPANLVTVSTSNGSFTSDFRFSSVEGYVSTDVAHTDANVVSVSGTDGMVTLFDKANSSVVSQLAFPDLRSVAYGGGKLFVLDGEEGVNSLDPVSLTKGYSISLGTDYSGAKRTMDVHGENLVVSEGANGAGIYRLEDGAEQNRIQIPIVADGLVTEEIVTNAVTTNEKHLFMANGSAGVSAAAFGAEISTLGVLDLFGSSNYVRANDEYLFVASGLQGLQIVKINLAEDIVDNVCTDLPSYTGSTWMNINSGQPQGYSGSVVADGLNVNDEFTFCGSLSVKGWANVNSGGTFNMRGSMVVGQFGQDTGLQINNTMTIEGSLVIYGNLTLNSGAKLEFLGENSSVTVYGNVYKNSGHSITGDYIDTEGKLK